MSNYIMTLVELEYTTKNPSELGEKRIGSMAERYSLVSVLVCGSNAFLFCFELMM